MFIEHLLCTGTFLGTGNTVTDKIMKHPSPLLYSVLVVRAWLVKRKQTPWLSLLNRREQANTNTQTSIKGLCMGGGRSDRLRVVHEKVALCVAVSAEGCISEKDGLRLRGKWCQEGCNHGNSLVPPSLPSLCPPSSFFGACISTLKMREQKGCFLFTMKLVVHVLLLWMPQGPWVCHPSCHGLCDTCRERGCTCLPWAGGQHEVALPEQTMCVTLLTLLAQPCLAWATVTRGDSCA